MARIKRYNPDITYGLTNEEIEERISSELVNKESTNKTKSIKTILRTNLLTIFNLLNFSLGVCLFLVGSYKNLLFLGVIVCNIIIGIVQEIRSKIIIDKLSFLVTAKVKVRRNGKIKEIKIDEIVLDDIIELSSGNQIVVDSIIKDGMIEVNEANLTGESEPILKKEGDLILSGSFVVSGKCICKVEHIGNKNYVSDLTKNVKTIKKPNSEIIKTFNRLLKYISYAIVPMGICIFIKQTLINPNFDECVVNTVAALVGMIPNGLILLTSTVLAVSVVKLSKYNVLVQQLYSIETLARIDTLCLDKTGTITEGNMDISIVKQLNEKYDMDGILSSFSEYSTDENATIMAIKEKYERKTKYNLEQFIPFSSERKYSGLKLDGVLYLLGSPETLLKEVPLEIKEEEKENRVLVLIKADDILRKKIVNPVLIGYIIIKDKLRKNIKKTIKYFKKENVNIKIISGDNPVTVSNIAKEVEIDGYDKYIDLSDVKDKDLKNIVSEYNIFGRVKPHQKQLIIKYLKENNHKVGYIGDGVNDVLALKESDLSIGLGSGSDASRNVSELILLDDNFNSMPYIVNEGRRTINNIGNSGTLFLVKTLYSCLLIIAFLFINNPYPFIPIQMTLISVTTIGIPAFVLALEPNDEKIKDNFFIRLIGRAVPAALTILFTIFMIIIIANIFNIKANEVSTLCVILTSFAGFNLLYRICKPFNLLRIILMISLIISFCMQVMILDNLYSLSAINLPLLLIIIILMVFTYLIFNILTIIMNKYIIKEN